MPTWVPAVPWVPLGDQMAGTAWWRMISISEIGRWMPEPQEAASTARITKDVPGFTLMAEGVL
jgi:hypothetical protein